MNVPENQPSQLEAAAIIRRGGIIAFRTDTFYGLGVDPFNETAVRALKRLKGREDGKPILVLIADRSDVGRFIESRSALFDEVAAQFWPGPLTLVGQAHPDLPIELTAGTGTIGVRLPNDDQVRDLIRACGGALTATSANLSGNPPARNAAEVQAQFATGIELIIDSGEVQVSKPSTVLDLSGAEPRLIREGAVSRTQLRSILHTLV
jgi:L-threonylcarbamoyladenylate synthase